MKIYFVNIRLMLPLRGNKSRSARSLFPVESLVRGFASNTNRKFAQRIFILEASPSGGSWQSRAARLTDEGFPNALAPLIHYTFL